MKIRVVDGTASISAYLPVFIGTTGEGEFPQPGESLAGFVFRPTKGTAGILVFDHPDPDKRTPNSPTFFDYKWGRGESGLHVRHIEMPYGSVHRLIHDNAYGLMYFHRKVRMEDRSYGWFVTYPAPTYRKVNIIDLLLFSDGKITLDDLDARASQPEE